MSVDFRTKTPRAYTTGDYIMVEARGTGASSAANSTPELIDPETLPGGVGTGGGSLEFDIISAGRPNTDHTNDDFILSGGRPGS